MNAQGSRGFSIILLLIIGVIVGLVIAGVFAFINSRRSEKDTKPTAETAGVLLTLSTPTDGDVTSEEAVTVSGSTGKDTVVVLTGGTSDTISETKGGKFSAKVTLREGENELTVYAFDTDSGESAQTTLNVLYLAEELGAAAALVAEENTDVVEKNKDRIEKLKDKLATKSSELKKSSTIFKRTHVFGTITSISGTILTVETKRGDIKTVFTDDFTKFFSVANKGRSSIKIGDLKIGDRISAVGVGKDDTDGNAKFVVRLKRTISKRHALLGKVKEIDGKAVTLSHLTQTDREFSIVIVKGTKIKIKGQEESASVNDIKVGDVVVAVGTVNKGGTIAATKIFIVPGKREGLKPKESTGSATPSSKQ
jgi:hypothetical protein